MYIFMYIYLVLFQCADDSAIQMGKLLFMQKKNIQEKNESDCIPHGDTSNAASELLPNNVVIIDLKSLF